MNVRAIHVTEQVAQWAELDGYTYEKTEDSMVEWERGKWWSVPFWIADLTFVPAVPALAHCRI